MSKIERLAPLITESRSNLDEALRYLIFGAADHQVSYLEEAMSKAVAVLGQRNPFPGLYTGQLWTTQRLLADRFATIPPLEVGIVADICNPIFDNVTVKQKGTYPVSVAAIGVLAVTLGLVKDPWNISGQQIHSKESWEELIGKTLAILYKQTIEGSVHHPTIFYPAHSAASDMTLGLSQALELSGHPDVAEWFKTTSDVNLNQRRFDFQVSIDLANSLLGAVGSVETALAALRSFGRGNVVNARGVDMVSGFAYLEAFHRIAQSGKLADLPELNNVLGSIKSGRDLEPCVKIWYADTFMGVKRIFDRSPYSLYHDATRLLMGIYSHEAAKVGISSEEDLFDVLRAIAAIRESYMSDISYQSEHP